MTPLLPPCIFGAWRGIKENLFSSCEFNFVRITLWNYFSNEADLPFVKSTDLVVTFFISIDEHKRKRDSLSTHDMHISPEQK